MLRDSFELTVLVPHTEGKLLGEIVRLADVRDRRYRSDGVELDIRLRRSQFSQLRGRFRTLTVLARSRDGADRSGPSETG
jgi:hypothetical protein